MPKRPPNAVDRQPRDRHSAGTGASPTSIPSALFIDLPLGTRAPGFTDDPAHGGERYSRSRWRIDEGDFERMADGAITAYAGVPHCLRCSHWRRASRLPNEPEVPRRRRPPELTRAIPRARQLGRMNTADARPAARGRAQPGEPAVPAHLRQHLSVARIAHALGCQRASESPGRFGGTTLTGW